MKFNKEAAAQKAGAIARTTVDVATKVSEVGIEGAKMKVGKTILKIFIPFLVGTVASMALVTVGKEMSIGVDFLLGAIASTLVWLALRPKPQPAQQKELDPTKLTAKELKALEVIEDKRKFLEWKMSQ